MNNNNENLKMPEEINYVEFYNAEGADELRITFDEKDGNIDLKEAYILNEDNGEWIKWNGSLSEDEKEEAVMDAEEILDELALIED